MNEKRNHILAELKANQEEINRFFIALSEDQLAKSLYQKEVQWTVRQMLGHLITIEASMHKLFEDLLAGGPGFTARDFDVERFNRSQPQKLDGLSLPVALERFREVRDKTVAMVARMSEADLDREGQHPFHGLDRLERFVRWAYEHARLHLEDARKVIN